jgi:hypothetical protein
MSLILPREKQMVRRGNCRQRATDEEARRAVLANHPVGKGWLPRTDQFAKFFVLWEGKNLWQHVVNRLFL